MKHKFFKPEAYAAFAAAFLSGQHSNAQVIINDYDPDLRQLNWTNDAPENDSLFIDIDDNGIYDILFYVDDVYDDKHFLYIDANDCVTGIYGFVSGWGDYVAKGVSTGYLFGPDIDASNWLDEKLLLKGAFYLTWFNSSSEGCSYTVDWFNHYRPYYGLKINLDGETHYGWLRLDSPNMLGYHPESECGTPYGSPLDIFETAYEMLADAPISADYNGLDNDEFLYLIDVSDAGNFSELAFKIYDYPGGIPDYEEMRIYVIADSAEALNFSLSQALSLPAENYAVFDPGVILDWETIVNFSPSLKDIDGNDFNPATRYIAYALKFPFDDAPLSLSSPTAVMLPHQQTCELFTFINDVSIIGETNTAADIQVNFSANLYGEDQISEYRISLSNYCNDFDVSTLAPDQYKVIPISGAATYTTTLETILFDINGNPIGQDVYDIRIWAQPDFSLTSFPCISNDCAVADITAITNMIADNGITIIQNENQLQINIKNLNTGDFKCIVSDISGRQIITENLNQKKNSIALNNYATGIYLVTVYQNNFPAAFSKISILH